MGDFFNSSQFDGQINGSVNDDSTDIAHSHAYVSLSQIANLTRREEGLVIYRQKLQTVTTIGVVIKVEELTTKNVYILDDYTRGSPVEVQLWKNENDENQIALPPPIMEQTYIRVVGQTRHHDLKPFIVAFSIEPITSPAEIYTHFLEVIADSLILEKRMNASLNKGGTNGSCMDVDNGSSSISIGNSGSGFNDAQRSILNILSKYGRNSPTGLKKYEIKSYMPGISENIINEAITFLVNEGHIFSTTDDETFKSTEF